MIVWGKQKTPQSFINWSVCLRFVRMFVRLWKKGKSRFHTLMMILRNTNIHSFIEFSTLPLSIRLNCMAWISIVRFVCVEFAVWMKYSLLRVSLKHLHAIHLICDTLVTSFVTCFHISELWNVRRIKVFEIRALCGPTKWHTFCWKWRHLIEFYRQYAVVLSIVFAIRSNVSVITSFLKQHWSKNEHWTAMKEKRGQTVIELTVCKWQLLMIHKIVDIQVKCQRLKPILRSHIMHARKTNCTCDYDMEKVGLNSHIDIDELCQQN